MFACSRTMPPMRPQAGATEAACRRGLCAISGKHHQPPGPTFSQGGRGTGATRARTPTVAARVRADHPVAAPGLLPRGTADRADRSSVLRTRAPRGPRGPVVHFPCVAWLRVLHDRHEPRCTAGFARLRSGCVTPAALFDGAVIVATGAVCGNGPPCPVKPIAACSRWEPSRGP